MQIIHADTDLHVLQMDPAFEPRQRQIKVCKTGGSGFPPLALRIMGLSLRLARQCQDNELVKYWLEIVQETWICKLSPLNN